MVLSLSLSLSLSLFRSLVIFSEYEGMRERERGVCAAGWKEEEELWDNNRFLSDPAAHNEWAC